LLAKLKYQDKSSSEIVRELLGNTQTEMRMRKGVRPMDVLRVTANAYNLKLSQLKGKRRLARIVLPRQVAMYLMRTELGLQFEGIGDYFDRDHTTVMHS